MPPAGAASQDCVHHGGFVRDDGSSWDSGFELDCDHHDRGNHPVFRCGIFYPELELPLGLNMEKNQIIALFEKWCQKLRIVPAWNVQLDLIEDSDCRKTGDFKIDCDDRNAVLVLNMAGSKGDNLEEIIVHELLHLKLYLLDQVTESLIVSQFEEGTPAWNFAYREFFTALEITVEELTKCYLLEFGENRDLSYGRCKGMKSYNELFDGLKSI